MSENKAMLTKTITTAARMAMKLAEAMAEPPLKQAEVATACGVTKQAVQGWLKTGRFDKKHLPTLAKVTGRPLAWWLDAESDTQTSQLEASQASSNSTYTNKALAKLQAIGDELSESDWQAVLHVAQQLAAKRPTTNVQDQPPQVLPEYEGVLREQVREAHEHFEQEQKQQRHRAAKA